MRLQTELVTLDGLTFTQFDAVRVEEELRSYLTDWPSLAQRHPVQTRQMLRKSSPTAFWSGARFEATRSATTSKVRQRSVGFSADWRELKGLVSPIGVWAFPCRI